MEIAGFIVWSVLLAYWSFHMGKASRRSFVLRLRRENMWLRKLVEQQTQAVIESDLDYELERLRRD